MDPGYCAGFETGGVSWRGVQVCDHLGSWVGVGAMGPSWVFRGNTWQSPQHTKCHGPDCAFCTDQETEAQRRLSDLTNVALGGGEAKIQS